VADGKSGPKPEMVREPDTAAACGQVADRVAKLAAEGVPLSEIAVLYMSKTMPGFNEPLPLRLVRELEARCVPAHWMSENYWTKRSFDQTADRVAVSTIHSAKGMDWRAVVLVGLGHPPHGRWDAATLDRLGYVGMTRARERLVVVRVGVG
jgi:superfamily I DNA/RNA helicase